MVDNVPLRQMLLEPGDAPTVVKLPVNSERFHREIVDVDLRFYGLQPVPVPRAQRRQRPQWWLSSRPKSKPYESSGALVAEYK